MCIYIIHMFATLTISLQPLTETSMHDHKPSNKQEVLNQDASKKVNDKAKRLAIKAQAKKPKKQTAEEVQCLAFHC
jgi:hypothetical protein